MLTDIVESADTISRIEKEVTRLKSLNDNSVQFMRERPVISMKYQRYLIVTLLPINSRESSVESGSAAGIGEGKDCGLDFLWKQSNNANFSVR